MPLTLPPSLKALSRRERILLAGGAAAVVAFLAYMTLRGGAAPAEDIVVASPPPTIAPSLPAPPPTVAPPVASASVDGLMLQGVMGGGPGGGAAIIAFPDGSHRLVRVGREFLPGVTLKEVALRHVILATAGGAMRLEFNKAAVSAGGEATPAAGPQGGEEARRQRETLEFRTGLAPRKENGRITGFAVRPGARLGLLQRAGLQPGDVIVAVNGQAFESEEKVLELSSELAGSYTAEIDYLRGGKPMKASIAVNARPD
ncbi:type II secretion system protein N [Allosphingosinicella humi]